MRTKRAMTVGLFIAGLAYPLLLGAQGTVKLAPKVPAKDHADLAIRSAILARKFKGGDIRELMLSEPERSGSGYTYHGEFTVKHAGKMIHCEDWHFMLQEKLNGWIVDETTPGRCND